MTHEMSLKKTVSVSKAKKKESQFLFATVSNSRDLALSWVHCEELEVPACWLQCNRWGTRAVHAGIKVALIVGLVIEKAAGPMPPLTSWSVYITPCFSPVYTLDFFKSGESNVELHRFEDEVSLEMLSKKSF